ncbi:hypothetical protein EV126DRAFT_425904 [Verticillium dahliae]|nr:hypothetical protein EV126DRAFT_425904 [Verticillium dahliae]
MGDMTENGMDGQGGLGMLVSWNVRGVLYTMSRVLWLERLNEAVLPPRNCELLDQDTNLSKPCFQPACFIIAFIIIIIIISVPKTDVGDGHSLPLVLQQASSLGRQAGSISAPGLQQVDSNHPTCLAVIPHSEAYRKTQQRRKQAGKVICYAAQGHP